MTYPSASEPDELEITHAAGELTCEDVVSTFPFARSSTPGDGNPMPVTVRKPLP